jgi:hypothetical protein
MMLATRVGCLALVMSVFGAPAAPAQTALLYDLMVRYGVQLPDKSFERAFDDGLVPAVQVGPGAFATALAMLSTGAGDDRISAAYSFGILAGRSGAAASPPELAAAGQALAQMIASADRRSRIAGARVAGRVFASPVAPGVRGPAVPREVTEGLFALFNSTNETEVLAAMDALGLLREYQAVTSLTERYTYYRTAGRRALAGGALEALARIGDPSTTAIVQALVGDRWAEGRDPTALAVAFARERMLKDGSIAVIRQAFDDKSRRSQARGYLVELGALVP